jgi:pimeloyl-ACP methyl ester carboxylesterase
VREHGAAKRGYGVGTDPSRDDGDLGVADDVSPTRRPVAKSPNLAYLLAEARAPLEAAALLPVLPLLLRAPRGDGHHVVAIPPFGTGDAFTAVLRSYLRRLGYVVHPWGQAEILALHRLHTVAVARLREVVAEAGEPVSLIGHSLGGIYAREVARVAPEHVRRVLTVGSPFGGDLKSNVVWPMYESATGTRLRDIPAEVLAKVNEPVPVPSTAIYSRSDGVVSWFSCIDEEAPEAENIVIADRLAQAPGTHEPFRAPAWLRMFVRTGPWRRPQTGPR